MKDIKDYFNEQKDLLKQENLNIHTVPYFIVIQVGDNEASNRYIKNKIKDCKDIGIQVELIKLKEDIDKEELYKTCILLNKNPLLSGYMIQFPLPKQFDEKEVLSWIAPEKDVDGFSKDSLVNPATPQGIITYLEDNDYKFEGKSALVLGRSSIVGKPIVELLLKKNCSIMWLHSKSSEKDKFNFINQADLIICAVGKENTIRKEDFITEYSKQNKVKNNCIVFDVGINFNKEGKLVGDCEKDLNVNFQSPVPNGVGLLTRLQLLRNILYLEKKLQERNT